MTAQIAAYGRLVADPQLKTTSKGTQMTMASMAVPLPCSQADDGTAMMWLPSPFSTTEGEREKYLPVEEAGTAAAVTC